MSTSTHRPTDGLGTRRLGARAPMPMVLGLVALGRMGFGRGLTDPVVGVGIPEGREAPSTTARDTTAQATMGVRDTTAARATIAAAAGTSVAVTPAAEGTRAVGTRVVVATAAIAESSLLTPDSVSAETSKEPKSTGSE